MLSKTLEKLAFAKIIYLEGLKYSSHNTPIDCKLAILNFDLSITSLIIAVCLDKNENIMKPKSSNIEDFPVLFKLSQKYYNNNDKSKNLIYQIDALHKLRNSIQHGDVTPSQRDIDRHKVAVRDFFDDICLTVFKQEITFATISLSKLLKSQHEQELMKVIEQYIDEQKFSLAFNMIIICALYRYSLIRENIMPRSLAIYEQIYFIQQPQYELPSNTALILHGQFQSLYKGISDSLNTLALGEYYHTLNDLLSKSKIQYNLDSPYNWIAHMTEKYDTTELEIKEIFEELNIVLYGTENLITNKLIIDVPFIYDVHVENITHTSAEINFRVLYKLPITTLKLYLTNDNKITNEYIIDKDDQYYRINKLNPSSKYYGKLEADQQGDPEFGEAISQCFAIFSFETI